MGVFRNPSLNMQKWVNNFLQFLFYITLAYAFMIFSLFKQALSYLGRHLNNVPKLKGKFILFL